MIKHLAKVYRDPHCKQAAKHKYQELKIKTGQYFYEFKTQFIHLANKARILSLERFNNIYNKLTTTLQDKMLYVKHNLKGDFLEFCKIAISINANAKRLATRQFQ